MIRFHYFAYRREAGYIVDSVASLMRTMSSEGYAMGQDYDITVVDDAYAHMGDQVAARLRALGANYRVSTFDRGGNLRGQACLMGILSEYDRTVASRSDDVIIKLDPDTIVRRLGGYALLLVDAADMVCCDDRGAMYGMAYGFKASLLAPLITYFAAMPIPEKGQEDIYLGHRLRRVASRPHQIPMWAGRRYGDDPNGPDGRITCYNWPGIRGSWTAMYDQFDVVNIGQSRQHWVTDEMVVALIRQMVPDAPCQAAAPVSTVLPPVASDRAVAWSPLPPSVYNATH